MLRRAATLICRRPAAPRSGLPRHPSAPSLLLSVRQPQPQADLGGDAPAPHLWSGARGYARMARRLPPARPDGYSTSDGEPDEPDAPALEEEDLEPRAGADGEDSEGSEMEGFMLEYGSGSDDEGDYDDDEDGAEERDK